MKKVRATGIVGGQDCGLSSWSGDTVTLWTPKTITNMAKMIKGVDAYVMDEDEKPPAGFRWLIAFEATPVDEEGSDG